MIFNMVGGGGGGLKDTDAVLIVSVPTGSTVTATKGGVTLTPTIWVQNADNTLDTAIFSIKASTFDSNPWTVTATLGSDTASSTIVINAADAYNVKLSYTLYLIKNGIEQVTFDNYNFNAVTGSGFIKYESISSSNIAYLKIGNIDVTRFSTIELDIVAEGFSWNGGQTPGMGYSSSDPSINISTGSITPYDAIIRLNNSTGAININNYTLDVSNAAGNKYIWVLFSAASGKTGTISISDFKLIPI